MCGGVAASIKEVRGTDLSWIPVFNPVVLTLPWTLLATRDKEALPSPRYWPVFSALCAVQDGGATQTAPRWEEHREILALGSLVRSAAVLTRFTAHAAAW